MKIITQETIDGITLDEDNFISVPRMTVRISKQFTEVQSQFIMRVAEECSKGRRTVNWVRAAEFFESDSSKEEMMKKVKYHYHNRRSLPKRNHTKKFTEMMRKLGLNI